MTLFHDRARCCCGRTTKRGRAKIRAELTKVIIGQNDVVDKTLISIFTKSHSLLISVPGLAKTLVVFRWRRP